MVELDAGEGDGALELAADRLWQAGATAVGLHDRSVVASFPTDDAARLIVSELGAAGASVRLLEAEPGWRDAWREFANRLRYPPVHQLAPQAAIAPRPTCVASSATSPASVPSTIPVSA